jgi:hypothetical protein
MKNRARQATQEIIEMLRIKIAILALAGIILAVIGNGMAFAAPPDANYYTDVASQLVQIGGSDAAHTSAAWISPAPNDNEGVTISKTLYPFYAILHCDNTLSNNGNNVNLKADFFWMRSISDGTPLLSPTLDGRYLAISQSIGQSRTVDETATVDTSQSTGTYGYDQSHSYYTSGSGFDGLYFAPNPSAMKYITLTN